MEIPFTCQVDEDEFERKEDVLYQLSKDLRTVFKDNEQEPWYSFTLSLERSGKFKWHYDYTNWFDTDYGFGDQMMIWKNKYLGEVSSDGEYKALIDRLPVEQRWLRHKW